MKTKYLALVIFTTLILASGCTPVETVNAVTPVETVEEPTLTLQEDLSTEIEEVTVDESYATLEENQDAYEVVEEYEEAYEVVEEYEEVVEPEPFSNVPYYVFSTDLKNKFATYPQEMERKFGTSRIDLHGQVWGVDRYSDGAVLEMNGVLAVGDEVFRSQLDGFGNKESIRVLCYGAHLASGYPRQVIAADCRVVSNTAILN